jgi:hypothetical protein
MSIFKRALNEREKKAGLQDVNKDKKKMPKEDTKKPSQADFFYGSASDLKKKKGK